MGAIRLRWAESELPEELHDLIDTSDRQVGQMRFGGWVTDAGNTNRKTARRFSRPHTVDGVLNRNALQWIRIQSFCGGKIDVGVRFAAVEAHVLKTGTSNREWLA